MNGPHHSPSDRSGDSSGGDRVRVGDADRHQAISDLGAHFADGRLSVTEYDERCHAASTAANRAELDKLFIDLPSLPRDQSSTETVLYSAAEVSALHRRGGNFRAGIMALTAVLSVTAASLIQNDFSVIVLAAIPVVAILLYVMKVGPVQWYAPSPQRVERARIRKARLAYRMELEEHRARRQLKKAEITSDALDFAHRAMGSSRRRQERRH